MVPIVLGAQPMPEPILQKLFFLAVRQAAKPIAAASKQVAANSSSFRG